MKTKIKSIFNQVQTPLLAVLGGILIGAIFLTATGNNPFQAYKELFVGAFGGGNITNLAATLSRLSPIVGMAMCSVISFRSGFANIGGEGQLVIGGLTAALVAVYVPLPAPVLLPLAILVGGLTAGLYALLAAFLQFQFHVPLIISTLLMNYPAKYLATYLVTNQFRDTTTLMTATYMVPESVRFPLLVQHTQLHAGVFIILAIVIIVIFTDLKTVAGYNIRLTGVNRRFANYGGVNTTKLGYRVMFFSGLVAGIVGAVEVLGVTYRFIDGALVSPQYAWTGLTSALLANANPIGALAAGIFFAALQTGSYGMERNTKVARELSRVLQAVIIMLVTASTAINELRQRLTWKKRHETN